MTGGSRGQRVATSQCRSACLLAPCLLTGLSDVDAAPSTQPVVYSPVPSSSADGNRTAEAAAVAEAETASAADAPAAATVEEEAAVGMAEAEE